MGAWDDAPVGSSICTRIGWACGGASAVALYSRLTGHLPNWAHVVVFSIIAIALALIGYIEETE